MSLSLGAPASAQTHATGNAAAKRPHPASHRNNHLEQMRRRTKRRPAHGVGGQELLSALRHHEATHNATRFRDALVRRERQRRLQALIDATLPIALHGNLADTVDVEKDRPPMLTACWQIPCAKAYAPVRFEGFERFVHKEAWRFARRTWRRELEARYRFDPSVSLGRYRDALERQTRFDANRLAWFEAPFPAYWIGHPDRQALSREQVRVGEAHEVFRIGGFAFHNDLRVRYRGDAALFEAEATEETSAAGGTLDAAAQTALHRPAHARAKGDAPRGNLIEGQTFSLDGRVRLRGSLRRTTLLRSVSGALEFRLHDRYDHAPLWAARLNVELDARGRTRTALTWRLLSF